MALLWLLPAGSSTWRQSQPPGSVPAPALPCLAFPRPRSYTALWPRHTSRCCAGPQQNSTHSSARGPALLQLCHTSSRPVASGASGGKNPRCAWLSPDLGCVSARPPGTPAAPVRTRSSRNSCLPCATTTGHSPQGLNLTLPPLRGIRGCICSS